MRRRFAVFGTLLALPIGAVLAQEPTAPAAPPPAAEAQTEPEKVPFRPLEGNVVINLPSVEVPREGTLTLLFTHRFQQPVQDSDVHDLWSFDNGAHIGIGLWYAPVRHLNVGFYRSSELDVYEATAQYEIVSTGPFAAAVRLGEDWRTEKAQSNRSNFVAQAMLALSLGERARVTVVPTYASRINSFSFVYPTPTRRDQSCEATPFGSFICSGLYEHVFNVPVAASVAITHSITVHGEVTPRLGKVNAKGVGWVASVEKSLLRHRFCFTAGNQRHTTVDQYVAGVPFSAQDRSDIYLGFNIIRQWKLK